MPGMRCWARRLSVTSIRDDTDGDGMSNLDEYISGNYAFDKNDGLRLDILNKTESETVLEFMAIKGRAIL